MVARHRSNNPLTSKSATGFVPMKQHNWWPGTLLEVMEAEPVNLDKGSLGRIAPFGLAGKDTIDQRNGGSLEQQRHGEERSKFRLFYPMILLTWPALYPLEWRHPICDGQAAPPRLEVLFKNGSKIGGSAHGQSLLVWRDRSY